jgi:hypothetical protein
MDKADLSDLSVVIPIKIDHQDRLDNLKCVVTFFNKYFINYELIIIEQSTEQRCNFLENQSNINYEFRQKEGLIHRTVMLNDGFKKSNRKFISSYDTDVIFNPSAIGVTMDFLRKGEVFVFPYNGIFVNVSGHWKQHYINHTDCDAYPKYTHGNIPPVDGFSILHPSSVGGAVFFNKEVFMKHGGYNKKFIAWGFEDNELVTRYSKLGYNIKRVDEYCLYHLNHFRGADSTASTHYGNNQKEFNRVTSMTLEYLQNYITTELL